MGVERDLLLWAKNMNYKCTQEAKTLGYHMKTRFICTCHLVLLEQWMSEATTDWACDKDGGNKKRIQNFGGEAYRGGLRAEIQSRVISNTKAC
jgi:hypothetical protein